MTQSLHAIENLSLTITEEIHVRSSLTATFAALLEEMGPSNQGHNGVPMPMTLEAWPGGRWFRDLGDENGHFWGHVQAIKRPTLLEITGPLMMSSAVVSNLQYRLKEIDGGTLITLRHTALGIVSGRLPRRPLAGLDPVLDRVRQRRRERVRRSHRSERGVAMALIEGLLQELEQEAQDDAPRARARPRQAAGVAAARKVEDARRAGAARRDSAGRGRRAHRLPLAGSSSGIRRSQPDERFGADSGARREPRQSQKDPGRHGRRGAHRDVADDAGRPGAVRGSAGRVPALDHAEPLVSPPRPADRLPARAGRGHPVDLRPERRRESVRLTQAPAHTASPARLQSCALAAAPGSYAANHPARDIRASCNGRHC